MFDVLAYVLFVLVVIGLLRYVMGSVQDAEAAKQSPPGAKQ